MMTATGNTGDTGYWRPQGRIADAALTVAVAVVVIVPTVVASGFGEISAPGWLLMIVASAAVFFRRDYPLSVTLVTLIATTAFLIMPDPDGPIVVTFAIGLYTLMSLGRFAAAVMIGAVAVVASVYGEYGSDTENLGDIGMLFFVAWLITVMAIGGAVYNRRAYLREAEQRMLDAERNRDDELRRRTTEERLRIARELHDVLGHTISLINVQAGAALHRLSRDPAQAGEALAAIKESSHDALRELRTTLGVLRQVDEQVPTAPAPSLSRVRELIRRSRSAGLAVDTEIVGEPGWLLPPAVDLAGYRIVQEALTNVTRHAEATAATVRIRYDDDHVELEIDDNGRGGTPGDGTGIIGMRERAASVGGALSAGPRPGGGFRVHARLPVSGAR